MKSWVVWNEYNVGVEGVSICFLGCCGWVCSSLLTCQLQRLQPSVCRVPPSSSSSFILYFLSLLYFSAAAHSLIQLLTTHLLLLSFHTQCYLLFVPSLCFLWKEDVCSVFVSKCGGGQWNVFYMSVCASLVCDLISCAVVLPWWLGTSNVCNFLKSHNRLYTTLFT